MSKADKLTQRLESTEKSVAYWQSRAQHAENELKGQRDDSKESGRTTKRLAYFERLAQQHKVTIARLKAEMKEQAAEHRKAIVEIRELGR